MKTPLQILFIVLTFSAPMNLRAQSTAFTYQGLLSDAGSPAQGSYDLQFTLYDAETGGDPVGGVIPRLATPVADGRFTVTLDYGAGPFAGQQRWLEISLRLAGTSDPFTILAPRQALLSAPYAIRALEAAEADHATSADTSNTAASAPWSGLTGVPAGLAFLGSDQTWTGTNTFTNQINLTSPDAAISATDGHPLDLLVDDLRALRLESAGDSDLDADTDPDGAPNVIAGSPINSVVPGAVGATISGGGASNFNNGLPLPNVVEASFGTISGGYNNTIESSATASAIGGGYSNTIISDVATIAGGNQNTIEWAALGSTIAGGAVNTIRRGATDGAIGGGFDNTIQDDSTYATIPGGQSNSASSYGLAAGRRAKANHTGTFVWADSTDSDFASTADDQFLIRATGGIGVNTDDPDGAALNVAGTVRATSFEGAAGPLSLSTTGNQPLELIVNGARSLRLEPSSHDSANVIAGGAANSVAAGVAGATISGGGAGSFGGSNLTNHVASDFATVSGGRNNVVSDLAQNATIGGGQNNKIETGSEVGTIAGGDNNTILGNAKLATIGGGGGNTVEATAEKATISGGFFNTIREGAYEATIGGGTENMINLAADRSVIAGGHQNSILSDAQFATIPGGDLNSAATRSFAAGHRAKAIHPGSFVWADSTDSDFASTGNNQLIVRASGGMGINKNNPATALDVGGEVTATSFSGAGSGLTALNAGQLTAGTLPDARLSGNVARRDTANTFSATQRFNAEADFRNSARLSNTDLYLRTGSTDTNHGLGYYSGTFAHKPFGTAVAIDGPVLYGWFGGALGTKNGGNKEVLFWNSNNRVGIGITSPGFNLHVDGSAGKPGGGSWSVASDERLKKNIRPLSGALDQLLELHGVSFEYKNPEAIHELPGERTGLIAQDVEKVFPDWVEDGTDGMKRLTVRGFEALTIEALRQEHDERTTEIAELKQEVAELKQLVQSLVQNPNREIQ